MTVASEKDAYILTDRATYLANQDNYQLEVLVEGDTSLLNVYHVITVTRKMATGNYDGALAFANFMTDPATQKVIAEFGVENSVSRCSIPMRIRRMQTWAYSLQDRYLYSYLEHLKINYLISSCQNTKEKPYILTQ